jgi:hypothetical protein
VSEVADAASRSQTAQEADPSGIEFFLPKEPLPQPLGEFRIDESELGTN